MKTMPTMRAVYERTLEPLTPILSTSGFTINYPRLIELLLAEWDQELNALRKETRDPAEPVSTPDDGQDGEEVWIPLEKLDGVRHIRYGVGTPREKTIALVDASELTAREVLETLIRRHTRKMAETEVHADDCACVECF